jgi:hypothetical protein
MLGTALLVPGEFVEALPLLGVVSGESFVVSERNSDTKIVEENIDLGWRVERIEDRASIGQRAGAWSVQHRDVLLRRDGGVKSRFVACARGNRIAVVCNRDFDRTLLLGLESDTESWTWKGDSESKLVQREDLELRAR